MLGTLAGAVHRTPDCKERIGDTVGCHMAAGKLDNKIL